MDSVAEELAADLNGQHVSGFYALILLSVLRGLLPAQGVQDVLDRAGETRTLAELDVVSSWSTYGQFRRLLEEAVRTLDGARQNLTSALATITHADDDMAQIIQGLGSPREVFISGAGTNPLLPIRRYEMTEVGEREWTIREWFVEGFEPYDEFCRFVAGQYSQIPMFFGLPAAEVVDRSICLHTLRQMGRLLDAAGRSVGRVEGASVGWPSGGSGFGDEIDGSTWSALQGAGRPA